MKSRGFSEERIIGILKQGEAGVKRNWPNSLVCPRCWCWTTERSSPCIFTEEGQTSPYPVTRLAA
jgi:hypothetical protein